LCPQVKRRRHLPALEFHARDCLPPCVPQGERWQQSIANRTFKSQVIQLVIRRMTSKESLARLKEGQSLVIDYQGPPVQYLPGGESSPIPGMTPLGEADVKFPRYMGLFESLQVDSVDGDSIPIALLHMERGGAGRISILRLETKLKEEKVEAAQAKKRAKLAAAEDSAPDPRAAKSSRVYEYVNVRMLYEALLGVVIPQCTDRVEIPSHRGHEISMLVSLIGLSGTDFTRGLPLVSGKTIYEYMPSIWARLARAYHPASGQLVPEAALDLVVSLIYFNKFERHATSGTLDAVMTSIARADKLSVKTRERLPSREVLDCTVRNVNWLLCYWRHADFPDPVQPEFGFSRDKPGGAVRFAA
jgi:hypothetical protein